MTAEDQSVIDLTEKSLQDGLALKVWFDHAKAADRFAEKFRLIRAFNPSDESFAFFDQVDMPNGPLPVNGIYDEMLYDYLRPLDATGREGFREFVLHYLLRLSDFHKPSAHAEHHRYAPPDYLQPFSWCPQKENTRGGFGFSQHYYKLWDSGNIGKFKRHEEFRIVDLRKIVERYEWLVIKVRIFDFRLTVGLPGLGGAQLALPLREESNLVISPHFIVDRSGQRSGELGEYGFGYAFIKNPGKSDFAYGPGEFGAAYQTFLFRLLESGEIRVETTFVENRPEKIMDLTFNPVGLGFSLLDRLSLGLATPLTTPFRTVLDRLPLHFTGLDPVSAYIFAANALTRGEAGEDLCISREQLEKYFLLYHYVQHYQMLTGSLLTWRRIPDWLNAANIPEWVASGKNVRGYE